MVKFEMPIAHEAIGNLAAARDEVIRVFYGIEIVPVPGEEDGWDAVCYITYDGRVVFVSSKAAGPVVTDCGVSTGASMFILEGDPHFTAEQVREFAENAEFVYQGQGLTVDQLIEDMRAIDEDRPCAGLAEFFGRYREQLSAAIGGRSYH